MICRVKFTCFCVEKKDITVYICFSTIVLFGHSVNIFLYLNSSISYSIMNRMQEHYGQTSYTGKHWVIEIPTKSVIVLLFRRNWNLSLSKNVKFEELEFDQNVSYAFNNR